MDRSSQVQPEGVGNSLLTGFQLYDAVVKNYSETLHMQGFAEQLGYMLWYMKEKTSIFRLLCWKTFRVNLKRDIIRDHQYLQGWLCRC